MPVLGVKCKRFKGATRRVGHIPAAMHAPCSKSCTCRYGWKLSSQGAVLHVSFSFVFSPFLISPKPVTFHKPGVPHAALISTF